jgi:hypothetical protein
LPSSNSLSFVKGETAGVINEDYSYTFGTLPSTFSTSPSYSDPYHWSFYATLTPAATAVNGMCGSSNAADLTSAPATNLCSTGTASAVSGSGPWTWTCAGSNGGTTASCEALLLVNGACGSSNGADLTSAPTTNLCSAGTASSVAGAGPWSWTCAGSNGGTTASCSANLLINGACGSANGAAVTSAPTANLCSAGVASAVTGSGPWDWTCAGISGGTTASCSAPLKSSVVNGACGSSNGADLTSAPTANLCSTGTASAVTGSGPWDWTCAGSGGGTTASCSANLEISGACGSANGVAVTSAPTSNLCTTGTASSVTGSGPWDWSCAGSNGGSTASCSAPVESTGQSLESIALSGSSFVSGSAAGYPSGSYIGTLSTILSPATPVFDGSYQLVASGGSCSGGDTTHFEISGDAVEVNGAPPAGTYTICVKATEGGTSLTQGFTLTGGNLINASSYCAANGGGNGSASSPWQAACIQAAVNAANPGDTVFLAAGNWKLNTANSSVSIATAINLVGAGSGNTFDTYGHPNNGFCSTYGASGNNYDCLANGTFTRVYTAGTNYAYAGQTAFGGGGYIQFNSCSGCSISNVFIDGSVATGGGDIWGTVNFYNGTNETANNVRVWAFGNSGFNPETQFYVFGTTNMLVQNSVFAEPPIINGSDNYPGGQVFQDQWHNYSTINNNLFYQQTYNGFTVDNITITGNAFYIYTDSIGNPSIYPTQADEGCSNTGCYNGSTTGDYYYYARNNLFYTPGNSLGIGGGVNDPTTNGIVNDQQWSGNWLTASAAWLDTCVWRFLSGSCDPGEVGSVGMQVDGMSFSNNSVLATASTDLDFRGDGCPGSGGPNVGTGSPCSGSTLNSMQCVDCSAQDNFLSSPSNQYLTDANSVNPSQRNNYCTGSSFSGCKTSGFTTAPTVSFTLGNLYEFNGTYYVPFTATSFTAQYGAVQWLASTSSTPPTSSDSRWSSNNASFPDTAANSYIPPVYLSGVAHGDTVYLWVMDSANHISAPASALIP